MSESPYQDEISLRDLYLILRRNLLFILALVTVAGLATFFIARLLPTLYEAESATLVTPQPIQLQSAENLSFRPSNDVSFEAYQTLAQSRPVIEATLAALPEAGLSYRDFGGEVEVLIGPQQPDQSAPLSVIHRVRHQEPELASRLANTWAEQTLEAVRNALLASLEPISERTREEIAGLRQDLEATEAAYETFQAEDQGGTLQALLGAATQRLTELERNRARLERQQAADEARAELLLAFGPAAGPGSSAEALAAALEALGVQQTTARLGDLAAQDEALGEQLGRENPSAPPTPEPPGEALDAAALERLAALLRSLPEGAPEANLLELLNQAELRARVVELAAAEAELGRLAAQQAAFEAQAAALREEIARLERIRTRLERERTNARLAFENVVALQPFIDYLTSITPLSARILNEAAVPETPVAPRPLLATTVAIALVGVLAVLFVFLREAVRGPLPKARAPQRSL